MARAAVTNVDVGKKIGMTHAGVSRLRSGDRYPSLGVMMRVADAFNWDLTEQAVARSVTDDWHVQFEKRLVDRYGAEDRESATA